MPPPIAGALRRGRSPLHRSATPRAGADRGREPVTLVGQSGATLTLEGHGYRCISVMWLIVRLNHIIF
jgi:hypothetical protein